MADGGHLGNPEVITPYRTSHRATAAAALERRPQHRPQEGPRAGGARLGAPEVLRHPAQLRPHTRWRLARDLGHRPGAEPDHDDLSGHRGRTVGCHPCPPTPLTMTGQPLTERLSVDVDTLGLATLSSGTPSSADMAEIPPTAASAAHAPRVELLVLARLTATDAGAR